MTKKPDHSGKSGNRFKNELSRGYMIKWKPPISRSLHVWTFFFSKWKWHEETELFASFKISVWSRWQGLEYLHFSQNGILKLLNNSVISFWLWKYQYKIELKATFTYLERIFSPVVSNCLWNSQNFPSFNPHSFIESIWHI